MRKFVCFVISFFFGILPIYALTFNVEAKLNNTSVKAGDMVTLDVKITKIANTQTGISSCEMNLELSDGLTFSTDYEVGTSDWKYEKGNDKAIFYSVNSYFNDFKLFSVKIKVNKAGTIKINNITCFGISDTDAEESANGDAQTVSVSIKEEKSSSKPSSSVSSADNSSPSSLAELPSSSSNSSEKVFVRGFNISGGTIDFDPETYNYVIKVPSFDNVFVAPILGDGMTYEQDDYLVDDDGFKFVFIVSDGNGESKEYTILFLLDGSSLPSEVDNTVNEKKPNYTIYFVAIIIILLGINVFRIITNKKKVLE